MIKLYIIGVVGQSYELNYRYQGHTLGRVFLIMDHTKQIEQIIQKTPLILQLFSG